MNKLIELNRSKENKWILQKNISSRDLFLVFIDVLNDKKNLINVNNIKKQLKDNNSYRGRSKQGSSSTMGVRLSQACFYMFGYKKEGKFFPSPMTDLFLSNNGELTESQISLINLYSMQFPSPYSKTSDNFRIYIGRLIVKLLLDKRLDEKLYIDECIFFLMFLEKVDSNIYEELVDSILEFRQLSYKQKENLFKSIENYEDVFANATHEMNYYFLRIFSEFDVLNTIGDETHNEGNLFRFHHGNNNTYRTDAFAARKNFSGFIIINPVVKEDAIKLNNNFSAFDLPLTQAETLSKDDWIRELYRFKPLEYIETIMDNGNDKKEIIETVKNMVYNSKYGSRDGKSFEYSLKPVFEMFRETRNVEIISGSGDTDLLCTLDNDYDELYKINVDAKTSKSRTALIASTRIMEHIRKNGSKYCIIVSPRFAKGVKRDIKGFNIVTIEAETLANYCLNDCLASQDNLADYSILNNLISDNLGTDITNKVNNLIEEKFELV